MKEINFSSKAIIFDDFSQLLEEDRTLLEKAITARNKAYAPYSKFNVGAAVLLDNDKIILGNNQENAAYPSGMCAERVAIWRAGSEYPDMIVRKIAISAASLHTVVDKPVGPCGACRQALYEYEFRQSQPIEIIFMGETGKIIKTESLSSLLPFSFDSSFL